MTCRGCEQTRQLFFHVWRKVKRNKPKCVVKGCTGAAPVCRPHWRMLSINMRRHWWHETNYDHDQPSQELIDEINNAIVEWQKRNIK